MNMFLPMIYSFASTAFYTNCVTQLSIPMNKHQREINLEKKFAVALGCN